MPENNECQPIVIFPLGVACQVTNPSGPSLSNGSATLIVTGGTPPYNITWENGNSSFAIDNLSAGSYPATIVDYYGDFTANTTCVLVSPTTTTTTLPSTPMCFGVITEASAGIQCTTPALGYYNGKPYYELYLVNCGTPSGIYVWWDSEDIRWIFSDDLGGCRGAVAGAEPHVARASNWVATRHWPTRGGADLDRAAADAVEPAASTGIGPDAAHRP